MRELIERGLRAAICAVPYLDTDADAVALPWDGAEGELVFTTDGFTVQPLEFPGGNIGSLAVHGTTNDLAVAGAVPRYLSLNAFIEEGFDIATLDRLIASLAQRRGGARGTGRGGRHQSTAAGYGRRAVPRDDRYRSAAARSVARHAKHPRGGYGAGERSGRRRTA